MLKRDQNCAGWAERRIGFRYGGEDMSQFSVPCCVYRGGTSRGLMFHGKDLPADAKARERIFMAGIDAWNPSQVDGLGGTSSSTSKVCVISPPSIEGVDGDWTFYQVGVGEPVVDDKGTCGNMMAAVGAFLVDEGLAKAAPEAGKVDVYVYNTNIGKTLHMEVPVIQGKARVSGGYAMPGVVQTGAMLRVSIVQPGGEMTGKLMPLGKTTKIVSGTKTRTVTFSDLINPFIFLSGADLGLAGDETHRELAGRQAILDEINLIRDRMAVVAGMAGDEQDARQNKPNVPKIAVLAPPRDYVTTGGETVRKEEADILVKAVSLRKLHRTCPASGLYNLAAVTLMEGSVPHRIAGFPAGVRERMVRIGHPEGVVEVRARLTQDGAAVESVGMERTARRIMKGELFIPDRDEE
jgi:2-methylaconitate cis-trans-isomerase PrpF